jgi:lipopolysaccharide transport protein LptA
VTSTPLALAAFVTVAAAAGTLAADPKQGDSDALEMAADRLDLDVEAKSAVLSGNVRLSKGAMSVRCPRVEVRYDTMPHVTWVRGSGGVTAEVQGIKAQAPTVEIDLTSQTLELRGGVRLSRGEGWITAERASIQIATGKVEMTGVKGLIPLPRQAPPL